MYPDATAQRHADEQGEGDDCENSVNSIHINRVKNNLKDVKGIKSVETSVADQTVTIQYDAKKTSEGQLLQAFEGFGFNARKLAEGEKIVKEAHECKEKTAGGDCKE